jgi:hypothetical protein
LLRRRTYDFASTGFARRISSVIEIFSPCILYCCATSL